MKLSLEEETFLRHWMYDEMHFREGIGPAKRLQLEQQVRPSDLAQIIAAAVPDPTEQWIAGEGPPPQESPIWPWSGADLRRRLHEAEVILSDRHTRA